jgi:glycosyltransferase involved in cell wall biosynthesis
VVDRATRAPRKVLMTADTVGGVWTYALELARALADSGVHVALATMGEAPSAGQMRAAADVPGLEVHASTYRLEWMDDPWRDVAAASDWLLDLEARIAPDVVHLNGYCHGALPWRAPTVVVAHSCVVSWWEAVLGGEAPPRYDRYRAEVARGLAAATAVVAPSRAMLLAVAEHHGGALGRSAHVIPNAADPRRFQPSPTKEPFVFTAGRVWDQAKNITALAEVAPRVPWPIFAAGDDRHPEGGRRSVRPLFALGRLEGEEVKRWMANAAIYALPARYEPFGLSILEAALSGAALCLGDIPSLRELWDGAALFVAPDDAAGLEAALRSLVGDPALRVDLAARASQRARAYTPRRMVRRYLALYRHLHGLAREGALHRDVSV